jgi:hypothetical protein
MIAANIFIFRGVTPSELFVLSNADTLAIRVSNDVNFLGVSKGSFVNSGKLFGVIDIAHD